MKFPWKPIAAAVLFVIWLLWEAIGRPLWNLNIERIAEQQALDGVLRDALPTIGGIPVPAEVVIWVEYLTGPFLTGFVAAALIFGFGDLVIRGINWISRAAQPRQDALRADGRRLSHQQQLEIGRSMTDASRTKTIHVMRDDGDECIDFAAELARALRISGATVKIDSPFFTSDDRDRGVRVYYYPGYPAEDAANLSHLLSKFEIENDLLPAPSRLKEDSAPIAVHILRLERPAARNGDGAVAT